MIIIYRKWWYEFINAMDFLASRIAPSSSIRSMLVASSIANGIRNVLTSWSYGFYDIATLDAMLALTSVLWWKEANDRYYLGLDQTAIAAGFLYRSHQISRCSEATNILAWFAPGASLIFTSYFIQRCTTYRNASYYVWIAFHVVQTHENSIAADRYLSNCTCVSS